MIKKLPESIQGKIVEIEDFTLSEEMRKRYKTIVGHLALSTSFKFVEIDLSSCLPAQAIKSFHVELSKRSQKRSNVKRKAERERIEHQRAVQAKLATINLNDENFPAASESEEIPKEILDQIEEMEKMEKESAPIPVPTPSNSQPITPSPTDDPLAKNASPQGSFLQALKQPKNHIPANAPVKKERKGKGKEYVLFTTSNQRNTYRR